MAEVIVGQKITAATGAWHTTTSGTNQQALLLLTATEPLFLHRLGFFARRAGGSNARAQLAVWARDDATGLPGELLGYTADLVVGSAAALFEGPLVWSKAGVALGVPGAAIRLAAGQRVFLGVQTENGQLDIARPSSGATATVYRRQTSGNPSNPFGTATTAAVIPPGIYGVAETNAAATLTLTGPAASIGTTTPTLPATFVDAGSGAPVYDRMQQYELAVRQVGTTDLLWNPTFVATPSERSAAAFAVVYNGTTLSQGAYEWQARAMDDAGTFGPWSAWRAFTIENLGGIDTASAGPTGKLEDGVVATWTARWTHPLALAANAAKVRILSGGIVVRESPLVTLSPTVAANAFISLTGAQATVATATNRLPAGVYTWQMQARDSNGNLSPWSADVALAVNAPPNQPSALRPTSGVTVATRPLLDWLLSDPDLDDVLGVGLVSVLEVTRPDTTIWSGETANVDPTTGRGYFQITPTQAPGNGVHQWRIRGRDTSAVGTPNEFGPWSPPSLFTLVTAPIVTITAPTENAILGTSTPQFQWTIADGLQAFYRVQLYRAGQTVPFFSTGQLPVAIPAASGQYTPPAGWLSNGLAYEVEVTIWTSGGITSTSPRRSFTVSYADAALVQNVTAGLLQNRRDFEPTSVALAWSPTQYPQSQFVGYVIWRRPTQDDPDAAVPIALLRAPGQTGFVDHHPPPNLPLVYAVSQLRRSGNDVQSSPLVEVEIEVPLTVPVLVSLENGQTTRAAVMWLSTGLSGGFEREDGSVATWGSGGKKTWLRPPRGFGARTASLTFRLRSDARGTLGEHWADVKDVVESGDALSLRTERERIFGRIVPRGRYWQRGRPGTVEITVEFEEIAWTEAVEIAA